MHSFRLGEEGRLKFDFDSPTGGRVDLPSEQREREGEAPSGFAGGGGDASPYKR
ncbi:MAG: hypothetical protein HY203_11620 [Nitrospirae bacterium]|nr:hypothetical protein [Nitrospirota bacterium]